MSAAPATVLAQLDPVAVVVTVFLRCVVPSFALSAFECDVHTSIACHDQLLVEGCAETAKYTGAALAAGSFLEARTPHAEALLLEEAWTLRSPIHTRRR